MADHRLAIAGRAVEAGESQTRGLELGLDPIEEARPLREDQRLVPLVDDLLERAAEEADLGGARRRLTGDETAMAGGLAQAQQRLQGLEHALALGQLLGDLGQGGGP